MKPNGWVLFPVEIPREQYAEQFADMLQPLYTDVDTPRPKNGYPIYRSRFVNGW
jgi:hypothetical protein